jgi:pimeloyl-ACP methyl ester carboxylesterase
MRVETPPIVLIHGAWHGAWCFAALQAELDRRGLASYAIDLPGHGGSALPLGDLHGDADHVVEVLRRIGEPVVLVGHSYGGAVITEVAARFADIAHLVFIAAFALEPGESVIGLLRSLPTAPVLLSHAMQGNDDGTTTLHGDDAIRSALYGSITDAEATAAIRRLDAQPVATMTQPVSSRRSPSIPSTYVCCTGDNAVDISHQRVMATRCSVMLSLESDHSPFLSMPSATADILTQIAHG